MSSMFSDRVPETILLVDDHGPCRETTARLLGTLGYQVLAVPDEVGAELMLARHGEGITAAVVDVCLEPSGELGFAKRIEDDHPDLPVVFISGYAREVLEALGLLGPHRRVLEKPFSLDQLERSIEAARSEAEWADSDTQATAA
jgi:two-component system cell cycle sensor histidine kinase/response regulator CckA